MNNEALRQYNAQCTMIFSGDPSHGPIGNYHGSTAVSRMAVQTENLDDISGAAAVPPSPHMHVDVLRSRSFQLKAQV